MVEGVLLSMEAVAAVVYCPCAASSRGANREETMAKYEVAFVHSLGNGRAAVTVEAENGHDAERRIQQALQRLVDGSDVVGAMADYQKLTEAAETIGCTPDPVLRDLKQDWLPACTGSTTLHCRECTLKAFTCCLCGTRVPDRSRAADETKTQTCDLHGPYAGNFCPGCATCDAMQAINESRKNLIRALENVLRVHDELSDTVVSDLGEIPSDTTRNQDPDVADARRLVRDPSFNPIPRDALIVALKNTLHAYDNARVGVSYSSNQTEVADARKLLASLTPVATTIELKRGDEVTLSYHVDGVEAGTTGTITRMLSPRGVWEVAFNGKLITVPSSCMKFAFLAKHRQEKDQ